MRSALAGDIIYDNTINADTTGSWVALNGKPIPLEGIPVCLRLLNGSASGSAGSVKVTVQSSADGSAVDDTLFEDTFTIPVSGGIAVEKNFRIFTRNGYVRAVFDFTGTMDVDTDASLHFVTGDVM